MNFPIFTGNYASLAQSVEQLIRNEQVVGSSPIGGSKECGFRIVGFGFVNTICNKNTQSEMK